MAVSEDGATRVEGEARDALGQAARNGRLDDAPVFGGGKIVFVAPSVRVVLDPKIDEARLEGLEHRRRIAVVVDANPVEIVQAARDRPVLRPIIWVALEREALPGLDLRDAVGA